MDSSLLSSALDHAKQGKPVFPCGKNKKPLTANGYKDATTNIEIINQWWTQHPGALIGIPTGATTGVIVLDVDFPDGPATLATLEKQHGPLPVTLEQRTGSGGKHLLFNHPGFAVKNSAGKIGPGLDVRGDGGYIIAAPSPGYSWQNSSPIAPLPLWLLPLMAGQSKEPTPTLTGSPYGQAALSAELAELKNTPEGGRNSRLNSAAYSLGQLVAGGQLDHGATFSALLDVALQIGLSEAEARATITSGMEAGSREPRHTPSPATEPSLKTKLENRDLPSLRVIEADEFMAMEFPPRETILAPWLPMQGLCMVYAPRGIGKTHFSLGVAFAVVCAGSFFRWRAMTARGVLFLDGEMPAGVLQERLARIAASGAGRPLAPLRIVTPDLQPSGMIDLSRAEDQQALDPYLRGIDLIIVDNLSTLCRRGKENEAESWLPVQEWALQQRAGGRSVLFIHHAGKNGEQRGTSRREDVLDTVIALRRPAGYTPDKGACFEVHFEKARGIYGDDTKPFEAQLMTTPTGGQTWTIKAVEESTAEKVAKLLNEGVPQMEIAEMLGITKGGVSRAKKRAQDTGLLSLVAP